MERIGILLVPQGGEPYVTEIENHFRAMQLAIGDRLIHCHPIGPGVDLVVSGDDSDFEPGHLPPNGCGAYGPYFFSGIDRGTGAHRSLTGEEARKALMYWHANKDVPPPTPQQAGLGFFVIVPGSPQAEAFGRSIREEVDRRNHFWDSL